MTPTKSQTHELERLRAELVLRDATIAAERAKIEALEIRLQLKAREAEIASLRAAMADASAGTMTTAPTTTTTTTPMTATTPTTTTATTNAVESVATKSRARRDTSSVKANGQRDAETSDSSKRGTKFNKGASTSAHTRDAKTTNKKKREQKDAPLEVVEGLGSSSHQSIKYRKTTNVVQTKDGAFIRVQIPGIMFCHRCKRTNAPPDNYQFDPECPSKCLPCKERVKILRELKGGGANKSPKKTALKLPPVGPDGRRKLLTVEREAKWRKIVLANVNGSVEECEALRMEMIQDEKRFTNSVKWDEEFIQVAAAYGRYPLRMINWGLSNGAYMNENAAKIACERKETAKTTPLNGDAYTSGVQVLRHLFKCGCKISCDVIHAACEFGSLECVKFLKENVRMCDFETVWKNSLRSDGEKNLLMLIAAQEGHVDVLEYLYDNNCCFSAEDARDCLELAKIRKPRAANYDRVVAYIKHLPEWAEYAATTVKVRKELD